MSRKTAITVN